MIDPHKANYGGTPVAPWRKKLAFAPAGDVARPAISIVTPVYDPAPILRETVQSVMGQSLQSWEWILVDDGSTDPSSLACLEGLAREDSRIRVVVHPENRGRSAARNTGLAACQSDYVFPLDQDDLLEPTALEKCLWFLTTHPEHHFVSGWCVGFGAQSYLWARGFERESYFLTANQVSGRALIRRTVFEQVGGYDETLREGFEDWELWLRCADRGLWGATIPEYLDWFRRKAPPAGWEDPARVAACRAMLHERYPRLVAGAFPKPMRDPAAAIPAADDLPFANPLAPHPRRILLVTAELDPRSNGALLLGAAEVLSKQGWQLTIAVATESEGGACEKAFAPLSADIHVMDHFLPASEQPRFLRHLIESRGTSVVLFESIEYGRALSRWLRARCPAPLYVELAHDDPNRSVRVDEPVPSAPGPSPFDLTIATTRALERALARRAERIEHVPPSIDTTVWKPRREPRRWLRPHWGAAADDLVILCAGRLGESNRPRVMCRTLLELARRDVPFRAVIQGEGDEREWIEAFVQRHALEARVRIEDAPSSDWLLKSMSAADLFFAPSRAGLPVLLLRAMAMGLPVVAPAIGALEDAVDASVGAAIEADGDDAEIAALADAIERVARDPELLRKLSRNARRRVLGRYGPDWTTARLLDVLAKQPPPARPPVDATAAFARAVEYAVLRAQADETARRHRDLARALARQADRVHELEGWNEDQARARSWLESQLQSWEEIAKQREVLLAERERWVQDLDKARKWLESQRENWQKLSEERSREAAEAIDQARRWQQSAEDHVRRIAVVEAQCESWRVLAEQRAGQIGTLQDETTRLEAETRRLRAENERLAAEQRAIASRLAVLSRRWSPRALRRGAVDASRALSVAERSGQ